MRLRKLLEGFIDTGFIPHNLNIKGLSLDSRQVNQDDLFFAYPGTANDGRKFIPDAIQKGATAILSESQDGKHHFTWHNNTLVIEFPSVAPHVSEIAGRFYDHPSKKMKVIGITGTNGKTSCSHLLAQTFQYLGQKSAVLGTIGYGPLNHITPLPLTTPDPITIQSILSELQKKGTKVVTMEASSHALHQGRLKGVNIDTGILMNIYRDHFDYHGNQENYAAAKHLLFEMPSIRYGIFNIDDAYGAKWMGELQSKMKVCGYSIHPQHSSADYPMVTARDIHPMPNGLEGHIESPWGEEAFHSRLLGQFNVTNLLTVVSVTGLLGYPFQDVISLFPKLNPIQGRMQTFGGGNQPLVVIDFSHKPEALKLVLEALRVHCKGKLICLFGCGGNRDTGKRPIMGKIAEDLSDFVVLTDDNVRLEDPEKIFQDVLAGMTHKEKWYQEHNREKAIAYAISIAKPGDIVLLAGKGHEDYQIIGDDHHHFSEAEIVQKILSKES